MGMNEGAGLLLFPSQLYQLVGKTELVILIIFWPHQISLKFSKKQLYAARSNSSNLLLISQDRGVWGKVILLQTMLEWCSVLNLVELEFISKLILKIKVSDFEISYLFRKSEEQQHFEWKRYEVKVALQESTANSDLDNYRDSSITTEGSQL